MFFGLILKANRKYTQTIKKAFHLSQAALDVTSMTGNDPVQLILVSDKTSYILCTLRKETAEQIPLDLNFAEGDEISFLSQGNGNVHLSGYLVDDDYLGPEEELELIQEVAKQNAAKQQKKGKKGAKNAVAENEEDSDEDEDDDDDEAAGSDMEEGEDEEEDDDDDDDDDDEDEEDGEQEEESDEDSEEEVKEPAPKKEKLEKPKQNGIEKPTKKDKKNKEQNQQQKQQEKKQKGEKILQGGVKIEDLRVGKGPEAQPGKKVSVYYEGRLKSNNKLFDSTKQGNGFKFVLGNGDVIKGWDIGVVGMKVGGKRRITCPPNAAYGAKGSHPVIPPNSTLVFEVELKAVH